MWDLPRPGLEPVSPAPAGRFLTTAPPGKPHARWSFVRPHSLTSPRCWLSLPKTLLVLTPVGFLPLTSLDFFLSFSPFLAYSLNENHPQNAWLFFLLPLYYLLQGPHPHCFKQHQISFLRVPTFTPSLDLFSEF